MEKVALVTGSNQGLGFALVETLFRQLGSNASVYLTARNEARGKDAMQKLRDQGLSPILQILDVDYDESVASFAETIKKRHGGVDIVISNAAARISPDIPQDKQVRQFINTNNHGTFRMIREFGPILKNNGRFLIVASGFGTLRNLEPSLHNKFDIDTQSLEDIEKIMDEYVNLLEAGQAKTYGWPDWINVPSKIGQVASSKIMARIMKNEAKGRGILINAVCPGMVDTAASRPWFTDMSSAQSPAEAAVDVVWLATISPEVESPYGELIQHREIISWK
jgi:carbonyl reductase 1